MHLQFPIFQTETCTVRAKLARVKSVVKRLYLATYTPTNALRGCVRRSIINCAFLTLVWIVHKSRMSLNFRREIIFISSGCGTSVCETDLCQQEKRNRKSVILETKTKVKKWQFQADFVHSPCPQFSGFNKHRKTKIHLWNVSMYKDTQMYFLQNCLRVRWPRMRMLPSESVSFLGNNQAFVNRLWSTSSN